MVLVKKYKRGYSIHKSKRGWYGVYFGRTRISCKLGDISEARWFIKDDTEKSIYYEQFSKYKNRKKNPVD